MAPFPMTVSKDKTLLSWKINKECLHGVAVFTSFMQLQTCVPEHTFTSMCYFGDKTRFLRQLFYGIRLRSSESLQRSLVCSSGCCCFRVSYPCTNSFLLMAVITSVIGTSAWFFSESRRDWAVCIRAPLPPPHTRAVMHWPRPGCKCFIGPGSCQLKQAVYLNNE